MRINKSYSNARGNDIPCEYSRLSDGFVHHWQFATDEITKSAFVQITESPQSYSGWELKIRRNGRLYLFNRGLGNYYDGDVIEAVRRIAE